MHTIDRIVTTEILDSRGFPTLMTVVSLQDGSSGTVAVPSGASTGSAEALEWRDGDAKRYLGKGVRQALASVQEAIFPAIKGQTFKDHADLDAALCRLDGTDRKNHLGANAVLAVSLAAAKAMAAAQQMPFYQAIARSLDATPRLPVPMMNILNGGAHADNPLDFQEFMIMPVGLDTFSEALRAGVEIFHALKAILKKQGLSVSVGDEGGFAPAIRDHDEALQWVMQAIVQAGYRPGHDVYLALDVASTEFYQDGRYHLQGEQRVYDTDAMVQRLVSMVNQYPILSIEDGMAECDWEGWVALTQALGHRVQLVGDDLFVTNTHYLKQGIERRAANAILIKPNQIGTLTETLSAINMADKADYHSIVSHRSGETEDTTIADIAVGTGCGQIKTGSLCRSDRVAKYNRLLAIESELGAKAEYAGQAVFNRWIGNATC